MFFFGRWTCAGLFLPPPTSSEEKMVRPLVFCLKMPPEYQFVLQFVAIRRPQRSQRYTPIYDKRQNKRRLVVKSFMCNCNWENSRYDHCYCILGTQTNFIKQINSIVLAIPCLQLRQTRTKLYTLFRNERKKKKHIPSSCTSPYRPYKGHRVLQKWGFIFRRRSLPTQPL